MKTNNQTRNEKIINWLNENSSADIDYSGIIADDAEINSFEELRDIIEDANGFEQEIVYYANAINYLKEHDASLGESLGIAIEFGYTIEDLSSETLASLHASKKCREDFEESENSFNNFLVELDETE